MFRRIQEYTAALQLFSQVLKLLENDETVYTQRGLVYQEMGNHLLAIEDFKQAIEETKNKDLKDDPWSLYYLGVSLLKSGDAREALIPLKKADDYSQPGENPGISNALGLAYHQQGNEEEAHTFFQSSIEQAKSSEDLVEFLCNRANLHYDLGDYDKATKDLENAIDKDPENSKVHYQQGLTWYAYRKYKKAIKSLKQALKYSPLITYVPDIYYHLGLSYCRLQKFEKAIFPFSKCVERVPSDLRFIHERAKAYQMIEWHKEAVQDFNVVITKNPKNAHAFFRRAFSLKALKVSAKISIYCLFRTIQKQLKISRWQRIQTR